MQNSLQLLENFTKEFKHPQKSKIPLMYWVKQIIIDFQERTRLTQDVEGASYKVQKLNSDKSIVSEGQQHQDNSDSLQKENSSILKKSISSNKLLQQKIDNRKKMMQKNEMQKLSKSLKQTEGFDKSNILKVLQVENQKLKGKQSEEGKIEMFKTKFGLTSIVKVETICNEKILTVFTYKHNQVKQSQKTDFKKIKNQLDNYNKALKKSKNNQNNKALSKKNQPETSTYVNETYHDPNDKTYDDFKIPKKADFEIQKSNQPSEKKQEEQPQQSQVIAPSKIYQNNKEFQKWTKPMNQGWNQQQPANKPSYYQNYQKSSTFIKQPNIQKHQQVPFIPQPPPQQQPKNILTKRTEIVLIPLKSTVCRFNQKNSYSEAFNQFLFVQQQNYQIHISQIYLSYQNAQSKSYRNIRFH